MTMTATLAIAGVAVPAVAVYAIVGVVVLGLATSLGWLWRRGRHSHRIGTPEDAAEAVEAGFEEAVQPLSVVVEGDPEVVEVQALLADLEALPGTDEVFVRDDLDGVTLVDVVPEGPQAGPRSAGAAGPPSATS